MKKRLLASCTLFLALAGAGCWRADTASIQNLPVALPSSIVELKDGDSYDLKASFVQKDINGVPQRMLAYNGMIPGPLIKVTQGASIRLRFSNDADVESSIHSHGLRLDPRFDGTHLTQQPVQPGSSFDYTLTFPDAGMYWYHPHFAESYAQELGLYGNYLVLPQDSKDWSPVNREEVLFLDDAAIGADGRLTVGKSTDHTLMGRYGNIMLVNGNTKYLLETKKGEVVRFYLTNSANTRPFKISFPSLQMKLVGTDGGLYERDTLVTSVVLGPSERAIVEVLFPDAGSYDLVSESVNRTYILGRINVSSESAAPSYAQAFPILSSNTSVKESIDPYRQYFSKTPDKRLRIDVELSGMMMGGGSGHGGHMMHGGMMQPSSPDGIEWEDTSGMMNAASNVSNVRWKLVDQDTGRSNDQISWAFKKGDTVKVRIFNDPDSLHPMQHPIHFHGQRFLVVAEDGKPVESLGWKDTVLIPAGKTVDLIVEMSNPGEWMAHCHISEHLEADMALTFTVSEAS